LLVVEVGFFKKRVVSGDLAGGLLLRLVDRSGASRMAGGLLLRLVDRSGASRILADLIVEALASKSNPRPFLATDSAFLTRVVGRVHDVWFR